MNKRNYIALSTLKGLKSHQLAMIVNTFAKIDELFELSPAQLLEKKIPPIVSDAFSTIDWQEVDKIEQWERASPKHHLLTFIDAKYPAILKQIADPPPLLYAKGNIKALEQAAIAMVGSRRASNEGQNAAFHFGSEIASKGFCVVSGLAEGIDSKAHQGALAASGFTVAVMGTGIDKIYPYKNRALACAIEENGLLLTEFPIGSTPMPYHFPKRNRIIAGLCLGVLVVEASLKSGSLITARMALEQGREVFSLPNSVLNPLAKGCHHLIKQGAKLIETIDDIIEEFPNAISSQTTCKNKNDVKKLEIYSQSLVKFVGYEITTAYNIMISSGLSPQIVNAQLIDLELKGLIKSVLGGYMRLQA